jgi:cytochrome oxidase Cu insertion factor (SCO1/SenC/PrrC family)
VKAHWRWLGLSLLLSIGAGAQPGRLGPKDGQNLRPDQPERVAVGTPAPDFTLQDATGSPVTLSSFRGTYVVLVFYRGHW